MASNLPVEQDADLPPPGSRSGTGAQSVLPYLTRSLQSRPAGGADPREAQPIDAHPAREPQPARPSA